MIDDYKNDMKKIQAVLDPVKKEKEFYDYMMKSLTKSATVAAKAISSILNTNAIKFETLNSMMQENIIEAMGGLTEAIKTINNCTGNLENVTTSTNINKLMEETFSLKPMVEEFARISSLSLNNGNNKSINFEEFDSDTVIDFINNNDDLSDSLAKPIKEFVNDNTNLIDDIISFYGDDNHSSDKTIADTKKEIDWKFIIGSILIPLLLAYWGSKINPPSTEINNNYNIEFKGDISHEDAEKIVEALEKFQHKNQQGYGIDEQPEQ